MFNRVNRALAGSSFCVILASCVAAIPPRDGLAQVHVDQVIKRIKCDIARAVINKTNQKSLDGKHYPYTFLLDWAAKLHFTISVDNTGSINPGATVINPIPAVGSVTQSRSVGIGAGLQSEAVRQEDYEYLMSFSDMKDEFKKPGKGKLYNYCQFEPGLLLESDLGLSALVDAALTPIEAEILYPGHDVGPGAAPPAQGKVPDPAGQLAAIANNRKPGHNNEVASLFGNGTEATDIEARTQAIINNIVKPLYAIASASSFEKSCLETVTQKQNQAIIWSIGVSKNAINYAQAADKDKPGALDAVKNDFTNTVNDLIDTYTNCAKDSGKNTKIKKYDPISTIGATVNFYITSSGSVTPTWKLINVNAPLASTFLSGSRKDTNSFILSMGRPIVSDDGSITASEAMNNQILASQLSQAISQRP
jgi:hypothetical protein